MAERAPAVPVASAAASVDQFAEKVPNRTSGAEAHKEDARLSAGLKPRPTKISALSANGPVAPVAIAPVATPTARPSPSAPSLWTLPETGLAIFHGHPDVPRLFHYFLPRLVAQGKPVLCLDGANRFDPLLIARFARSRSSANQPEEAAAFNQLIRVARAFTCFQLTELLVRAPRLLEKFPARALVVTALPDLYFDEDVREAQAAASFRRVMEALDVLRGLPLVTAVFSDATSFQTPRKQFFAQLVAQANQVSRFAAGEDGRLALAPAAAIDRAAPSSASPSSRRPRALHS
jgi:hypothetical protein